MPKLQFFKENPYYSVIFYVCMSQNVETFFRGEPTFPNKLRDPELKRALLLDLSYKMNY
jgi:hypothetical protein